MASAGIAGSKVEREPADRRAALGAGAIVLMGALATIAFFPLNAANGGRIQVGGAVLLTCAFTAFSLVGGLIAARVPGNATGWLMLAVGAGAMVMNFAQQYAKYGLETNPGSLPGALAVAWVSNWGYYAVLANVFFFLLLFPTGRPASRVWRVVLWADIAFVFVALAPLAFGPRGLEGLDVPNPGRITALDSVLYTLDQGGGSGALLLIVLVTSAAAPILRARRARGAERQQLKWLALGAAIFAICFAITPVAESVLDVPIGYLTWAIGLVALPLTIGVAILGDRLYELNLVVNRSLVYFVLTACLVAIYAGLVALLGAAIDRTGSALVATGVVTLAFQPLHRVAQRAINRLMYGDRDEPYAVLSRLAARLESVLPVEEFLATITEAVTDALRVPYAAIELLRDHDYVPAAKTGEPQEVALALPLIHRGEQIGRLLVSARAPGARFSTADEKLLGNIARQAGAAAYSVRLLAEVQKSRERLVNALEEERRRIRRDLHDGLGPSLAGMSLQLEAARNLVERDPSEAAALLESMADKTQTAIIDIRQLVYGLRPPALDELGLVGALSEQASRFETANGVRISVGAEGDLAGLPAATEVAAYRITVEAITNAAKHAGATRCEVRLRRAHELSIEVTDDGSGLPENFRWGVGITSMRERAEEVGGTLTLDTLGAAGTAVRAMLPVTTA